MLHLCAVVIWLLFISNFKPRLRQGDLTDVLLSLGFKCSSTVGHHRCFPRPYQFVIHFTLSFDRIICAFHKIPLSNSKKN